MSGGRRAGRRSGGQRHGSPVVSAGRRAGRLLQFAALSVAALFFAVPMLWLALAPTKTSGQMVGRMPFAFGSWPQLARTWHTLMAFDHGLFATWMGNSVGYVLGGAAIALGVALPAGYALAVLQFVGRRFLLSVTLIVMLVPANALVLPLFLEMHDFHLLGSPVSVILPFGFFPFGVYLAYLYFGSTLAPDVLAAARLDGCSEWRTFLHIALPLSAPVAGLVVLFNVVASWSNFFLPFVLLQQRQQYPIALGLQVLQSVPAPEMALALLVSCAPVLAVFIFAQRAMTRGLLVLER